MDVVMSGYVCVCVCVCVNRFRRHGDIKRLRHISFRRYQLLKSPDDMYVEILKNKFKEVWMNLLVLVTEIT
jgi:hypothetical protein